jgi:DHA2 family multidrug resistance protein
LLGGWLTENIDWRWVFYINLPVGVLAFFGIARYLPENRPPSSRLDVFGFVTLSLAIGLLQMFLDRGELKDWFNSPEICLEAIGALVAFCFFAAHTATINGPSFFNVKLLRDRNFVTGIVLAFIVGMILYATMALLPTMLQGLLGYPVIYTGEVTAPRGIGTMLAMIVVGRITNRVDPRAIMAVGFALTAVALYQMTHMSLDMDSWIVIESGFVQGLGIGFTFVPLSAAAFATLPANLRNDGTPMFSLLRNIGSSVGISIVQAMLTRGTARAHAELATHVSPANNALQSVPQIWDPHSSIGIAALNAEVTRQAAMIAYLQDFSMMMYLTIFAMPLLLLIRRPKRVVAASPANAEAMH